MPAVKIGVRWPQHRILVAMRNWKRQGMDSPQEPLKGAEPLLIP